MRLLESLFITHLFLLMLLGQSRSGTTVATNGLDTAWTPTPTPSSPSNLSLLQRLSALESTISVSWRNNDRVAFKDGTTEALAIMIPKALLGIITEVTGEFAKVKALVILSPIFSILSMVADVIGQTLFSPDKQFADLYAYLQENFNTVNAMIEANYHAIQDLKSVVLCGQAYGSIDNYKTEINAYFERYKEMTRRAQTDRVGAMAIFDSELAQYQSTRQLLLLWQLLLDKSRQTSLAAYCTRGSLADYTRMTLQLYHTFQQAIILDRTAKIRLYNFTKESLAVERDYWKDQVTQVVSLMEATATDLATKSWYNFYTSDADSSLSSSAAESAFSAAAKLNASLTQKYPYVRTALIVTPKDATTPISIKDAFGDDMTIVDQDSFVCYRSKRANGDTVIAICRSQLNYPNEQAELNRFYASHIQGILSGSLLTDLGNHHLSSVSSIMTHYKVSFFACTVKVSLSKGTTVTTVQSNVADNQLVFVQSSETEFQALVVAKLMADQTRPFSQPNEASSAHCPAAQGGLAAVAIGAFVIALHAVHGI